MITVLLCIALSSALPHRQRTGRVLVEEVVVEADHIPRDTSGTGRAGFRLPLPLDDSVTYPDDSIIAIVDGIPRDRSGDGRAGFRLTLAQGEEELIPIGNSGQGRAGLRLPLLDDDVVVIEAGDYDYEDGRGRSAVVIPRDQSGPSQAGFRLPLGPEDDFVITEAGSEDLTAAEIPRDLSGEGRAGFRLPLPLDNDFIVIESAGDEEGSRLVSEIPRDRSGSGRAGFRLPTPEDDVVVLEAAGEEIDETGRSIDSIKDRSVCQQPVKRSRCRARLSFYFFNTHSKQCQEYKFGGCGGEQANRFSSLEECMSVCSTGLL